MDNDDTVGFRGTVLMQGQNMRGTIGDSIRTAAAGVSAMIAQALPLRIIERGFQQNGSYSNGQVGY